jgi:hypothetical protein
MTGRDVDAAGAAIHRHEVGSEDDRGARENGCCAPMPSSFVPGNERVGSPTGSQPVVVQNFSMSDSARMNVSDAPSLRIRA